MFNLSLVPSVGLGVVSVGGGGADTPCQGSDFAIWVGYGTMAQAFPGVEPSVSFIKWEGAHQYTKKKLV